MMSNTQNLFAILYLLIISLNLIEMFNLRLLILHLRHQQYQKDNMVS